LPIVTLTTNYDGEASYETIFGIYAKDPTDVLMYCGYVTSKGGNIIYRDFIRFSLADLPSGIVVTQARLRLYCRLPGGSSHIAVFKGYHTNGQTDPEPDDAETCYVRCTSGEEYCSTDEFRTVGLKWINLGATACQHIQDAKSAVNRWSVAIQELLNDDPYAQLDTLETDLGFPAQLEITYESSLPSVGYSYTDGLVTVQVAG